MTPGGRRVAIVGASGAVGNELVNCLDALGSEVSSLHLFGSKRSAGSTLTLGDSQFQGKVELATIDNIVKSGVEVALFSAGSGVTKELAPPLAEAGITVIDNSSAFRMDPEVPLVVPEVNPQDIAHHKGIIANPNCSTILMNVVVHPLHKVSKVKRIMASTYQASSGAGQAAMEELEAQARHWADRKDMSEVPKEIFGRQYIWNLFSHNSAVDADTLYNEEEIKMVNETRKIFADPDILIDATCIRVPVLRSHAEAITIEFADDAADMSAEQARDILSKAPGVTVDDHPELNSFPEPIKTSGKHDVAVGRIRRSLAYPEGRALSMFLSGDQLLKGAALNAVQIMELLPRKK